MIEIPILSKLEKIVVGLLLAVVLFGGTYWLGYHNGYASAEKTYKQKIEAIELAAEKEAARLRAEGQRLRADLVIANSKVTIQTKEVIRYVTVNARANHLAVDAALTRMLNTMSGIRETSDGSSAAGTARADPKAATDPPGSAGTSEKAMTEWAARAVESHELCRLRHERLAMFAKSCTGQGK